MADETVRYRRTILASCCVPWGEDGELAEAIFRDAIGTLAGQGFDALYVFGTAGEGYAVDERRFDQVVEVFADQTAQVGLEPMVGVISLSLPTVVDRIERGLERGVRSFQLSLPSWGTLNDTEVRAFFDATCGRFPDASFLHYNVARAGRLLGPGHYAGLAQEHPNLVAVKHTRVDYATVHLLFEGVPEIRHFFTEAAYSYASLLGPAGFLVSIASVNPTLARAYFEAGVEGDTTTLMAMSGELLGMSRELLGAVGAGPHIDAAFDKMFSRFLDDRFPLRLLPPYQGATPEAFERFRRAIEEGFPRWAGRAG